MKESLSIRWLGRGTYVNQSEALDVILSKTITVILLNLI